MIFKQHASVLTGNRQEIGRLDRVVIDPKTDQLTHLVVRYGLLTAPAKVVDIEYVNVDATPDILLQLTAAEFSLLPDFEENVAAPAQTTPGLYWPRTCFNLPLLPAFFDPARGLETHLNIPAGTVAVRKGAIVIARDGKRTGQLEQVVTASEGERVTHLLIWRGSLIKARKLIPMKWIKRLGADEVHLAVRSHTVNLLPRYTPA